MEQKAVVDLIGKNGQTRGDVAGQLFDGTRINVGELRAFIGDDGRSYCTVYKGGDPKNPTSYVTRPINTNATLRRDEWKQLDDALLEISRYRLGGVQDLIDKNLVYTLGNAMGTTVFEWHDVSDAMEAVITMDGVTRGPGDRPVYQHNYIPIPIIHVDYEINMRVLSNSRRTGNGLDVTSAERAARKVWEKLESMLFTNITYGFGGVDDRGRNSIYSYLNHPDRNQVGLAAQWDAAGTTPAMILADVQLMKQTSINNLHFGPWMLYIPTAYETVIDGDYTVVAGTVGTTIRERIMKLEGITGIKIVDTLPAHNVLLVQMTSDVVRLIRGLGLQAVQWDTEGKFITKFKVLAIQVPQIRSDQAGKSGIMQLA